MTKTEALIEKTLEHDKLAVEGPWDVYCEQGIAPFVCTYSEDEKTGVRALKELVVQPGRNISWSTLELIAYYRTAAPTLARQLDVAMRALRKYSEMEFRSETNSDGHFQFPADEVLAEIERIAGGDKT